MKTEDLLGKDKTLIIRADANSKIGIGHVMRCLALAQEWMDRGGRAIVVGKIANTTLVKKIRNLGLEYEPIDVSYPDSENDAQILLQVAKSAPAGSWIVLDGYFLDTIYQKRIRKNHPNTLVIDDCHHLKKYDAAVILNQNLGAETIVYNVNENAIVLAGSKYVLLRKEFRTSTAKHPVTANDGHISVLVSMGGADALNVSLTILQALQALGNKIELTLVVGPAYPHRHSLDHFAQNSTFNFNIKSNVENMAELIAENDIIIGAGGSSCWEVCSIGRPLVIITTADNQIRISEKLEEAAAAVYLGSAEKIDHETIYHAVKFLVKDTGKRQELSRKALEIFDNKGVSRVVDILVE
ncbi:UDP-2,4-diacetamido-2,4,6-trideoxy-beta-L-altropyranose hydrolase [Maridesulfovibrio salexigens]|nr:UDP-2,4-diacetamido-2,4,6-trideoxy-beta-L-altropyranose hydrolase [Maridesulfovibrio salexigens]